MPARRIHILGAAGSGTTTLGKSLASALGYAHLDTDDHYWRKTDPPYTVKASIEDRLRGLRQAFDRHPGWVLSGSLCSWGDSIKGLFTDVFYLWVPWPVREARLLARETARHGERISADGDMRRLHLEFMEWAGRYDDPGFPGRSRETHARWLADLGPEARVHRLEGAWVPGETLALALQRLP